MAERDADRRAAGTMTQEEADRLSEQFRPSWEEEAPPAPPPARPAPPHPPRPPGAVPRAPVVNVGGPPAAAERPSAPPIALTTVKRRPGAEPALGNGAAPRLSHPPDDLDWEVPAGAVTEAVELPPAPSAPVAAPHAQAPEADEPPMLVDVEELPPESKPSGIGQKYVPKDEGAPPIVLGADVREAEYGAQLAAEHQTRRAPTIARINVKDIRVPEPALPDDEPALPIRRGISGWVWLLAGVIFVGGVVLVVYRSQRQATSSRPEVSSPATVAPDTAAAPPPAVAAAPAAPEPTPSADGSRESTPAPEATGAAAPNVEPTEAPRVEPGPAVQPEANVEPEPRPAVTHKAVKPAAVKPTSKPVAAAPKPPPTPARPSGSKPVIVRETPF